MRKYQNEILDLLNKGYNVSFIHNELGCARNTVIRLKHDLGLELSRKPKSHVEILCHWCDKSTFNPKFCSKSCAAKCNNTRIPKRIARTRYCKGCNSVLSTKRRYCSDKCRPVINWESILLKDISRNTHSCRVQVTQNARYVYNKSGKPLICKCGYDYHVEICHIKPVASFSLETPLSVINSINNLIALCPNCHYEFDNPKK